ASAAAAVVAATVATARQSAAVRARWRVNRLRCRSGCEGSSDGAMKGGPSWAKEPGERALSRAAGGGRVTADPVGPFYRLGPRRAIPARVRRGSASIDHPHDRVDLAVVVPIKPGRDSPKP